MSKAVRFWLFIFSIVLSILPVASVAQAAVESGASVLITELQTEGPGTPSVLTEEFIELTNVSDQAIDITGWELQTKSTGLTSAWTKLYTFTGGVLYPGGSVVVSHIGYLDTVVVDHFGSSISSTAGHLRLVRLPTDTVAEDKLGWGVTALDPEITAAPKPTSATTLSRKVVDDQYVDTNNNFEDFVLAAASPTNVNTEPIDDVIVPDPVVVPTDPDPILDPPGGDVTDPEEEIPTDTTSPTEDTSAPTDTSIPPDPAVVLLDPKITELFPDPVAPQTDANDEFVELFNPNLTDLTLTGYKLQTGSTFSYTYALDSITIPAETYLALTSGDTNLVLSNSGGAARLVTPSGAFIELVTYTKVEEGQAYALDNGIWQWTTTTTPNLANTITTPPIEIPILKVAATKIAKTTKATTVKAATTKAAAKTTAKTAAKKTTANTDRNIFEDPAALVGDPPIHPAVLVGVSTLAVLYAGYEYREDLRNRLFKLRSYTRFKFRHR